MCDLFNMRGIVKEIFLLLVDVSCRNKSLKKEIKTSINF